MKTNVIIPGALRNFADNNKVVEVEARSVRQLLDQLVLKFPALQNHIYDDSKKLRRFINIFLNEEDIRFMQDLDTPLSPNSTVEIISAISGG